MGFKEKYAEFDRKTDALFTKIFLALPQELQNEITNTMSDLNDTAQGRMTTRAPGEFKKMFSQLVEFKNKIKGFANLAVEDLNAQISSDLDKAFNDMHGWSKQDLDVGGISWDELEKLQEEGEIYEPARDLQADIDYPDIRDIADDLDDMDLDVNDELEYEE